MPEPPNSLKGIETLYLGSVIPNPTWESRQEVILGIKINDFSVRICLDHGDFILRNVCFNNK